MFANWLTSTIAIVLFQLLIGCSVYGDEPEVRPNVLWLTAEDIGPHLGCYGLEEVKTPALDDLAKRSQVYDVAWSNYPVCAPARTTIITGMYAAALGAGSMRCEAIRPEAVQLFPELLREAGYYCTNNSKTDYNFEFAPDGQTCWDESSRTAHWKNRATDQPFFAVFNNSVTHESKIRTRPHEAVIDPASVTLFPYWPDTPEVRQDWAQYLDNIQSFDDWVAKQLSQLSDAGLAEDTIVFVYGDHGSGMPRHKRYAGDSGMLVPMIVYVPEKFQSQFANDYQSGSRTNRPVGFVDLAPTVLMAAGVGLPAQFQGQSFLTPDGVDSFGPSEYQFGFRNRMDEAVDVSRSVRDERFVYIRNFMPHLPAGQILSFQQQTDTTRIWHEQFLAGKLNAVQSAFWQPRPIEELYDLVNDPFETVNLASDQAHRKTLDAMHDAMVANCRFIGDLDLVPESMLYEFEQSTGRPRMEFAKSEDFDLVRLIQFADSVGRDVPSGHWLEAIKSDRGEIRYWAIIGLMNDPLSVSNEPWRDQVRPLLEDGQLIVRVRAAEALLAGGATDEQAIETLLTLADATESNFYVAGAALDCLSRYRELLTPQQIEFVMALPEEIAQIKRSANNITKLKERFKPE